MRILKYAIIATVALGSGAACAPRQSVSRPAQETVSSAVSNPLTYLHMLLREGPKNLERDVEMVIKAAEISKSSSHQKPSPTREIEGDKMVPALLQELYESRDPAKRGLALVGFAVLGRKELVYEALENLSGESALYKKLVVQAAKVVDDYRAARGVAHLLLRERDEEVRSSAVGALLNMKEGARAVVDLTREDPSRIAAFKDIYVLFYLNAKGEEKVRMGREVLRLGRDMMGRASLKAYEAWKDLILTSGIAYDLPASTFAVLEELLERNVWRGRAGELFRQVVGDIYIKTLERLIHHLPPAAEEDIASVEREGELFTFLRAIRAGRERPEKAYTMIKPYLEGYLESIKVDRTTMRPAFLEGRSDGEAAFHIAKAALLFAYVDRLGVGRARLLVEEAKGYWTTMLQHIPHSYPITRRAALYYGGLMGAHMYAYAAQLVEEGGEEAPIAAQAIALLALHTDVVSVGSLSELIARLQQGGETAQWLGIALANALYYGGVAEAGLEKPELYGTHLALRLTPNREVVERVVLAYRTLLSLKAYEGAVHVLASLYLTYGIGPSQLAQDHQLPSLVDLAKALDGASMVTNLTLRRMALLAVVDGEADLAVAALRALERAGDFMSLSAAFTDIMAALGRQERRGSATVYRLTQPVPKMEALIRYLDALGAREDVASYVRGTALLLAQFLRGEEVYVLLMEEGGTLYLINWSQRKRA